MKAMYRNVILKEIKEEVKSSGGILLGDSKDVKFSKGEVLSVGSDVVGIKTNDIITYDKYRGNVIRYNKEDLIVVDFSDVYMVEEKEGL
jgi:co-chaperonin GroES (HSP10)